MKDKLNKNSIYFSEGEPGKKGIISYIISKSSTSPNFKINEEIRNPDIDFYFDPRRTYKDYNFSTSFVTKNGEKPFVIYDLYPYSLYPFGYSITLMNMMTPPIEWTISVSNTGNENDWIIISHPPKNVSLCPYELPSTQCTESVSYNYKTDNSGLKDKSYRYINFTLDKDRGRELVGRIEQSLRIQRIDFYGYLLGPIKCYVTKSCNRKSKLLFLSTF